MEKAEFTEVKATMLATLQCRMLDNRLDDPVLADPTAEEALRRIDFDFAKLGVNPDHAVVVATRAKIIDGWAAEFLAAHPDATVLHLGCGMDSRVYRLDPPSTVAWFDVDYPETIDLRRRIYPDRPGYRTIGSSVTETGWLEHVPTDRPTLVIAEGLTMYLPQDAGEQLVRRLIAAFPNGEMLFDAHSPLLIKRQNDRKTNTVVENVDASVHWGIDGVGAVEALGLQVVSTVPRWFTTPDFVHRLSPRYRMKLRMSALHPLGRKRARSAFLVRARF
jgi:O-methyltransferase involved in polyketide biosynthesis